MNATLFFFAMLFIFFLSGAHSTKFTFTNNCPYTIWPATLTGGSGAQLPSTGFELASKSSSTLDIPAPWTGRFWARTSCFSNAGRFSCAAADCGTGQINCNGAGGTPPASLVEFTLAAPNGAGQDFYDVSLVDGFNLPVSIIPSGGSGNCNSTSCPVDINANCPAELAVKGPDGGVIGCKSACVAFNTPQFCCSGDFNKTETCPPINYSNFFKSRCPQAYSYAYDDQTSTFTCTNPASYQIIFCP